MPFKILKVIIVILLLITLGEAGYYVYVLQFQITPTNSKSSKINAAPTVNPQMTDINLLQKNFENSPAYQSVKNTSFKNGQSTYIVQELTGYVGDITRAGDEITIKLDDNQGNLIRTFVLLAGSPSQFYLQKDGKKSPVDISNIQAGMKILIHSQTDLVNGVTTAPEFILNE